jgi:hypothetical protein
MRFLAEVSMTHANVPVPAFVHAWKLHMGGISVKQPIGAAAGCQDAMALSWARYYYHIWHVASAQAPLCILALLIETRSRQCWLSAA